MAEASHNRMHASLVSILRCPTCQASHLTLNVFAGDRRGEIIEGVLLCRRCTSWYPIEDYALELLPPTLAYWDDRKRFWKKHFTRLKGLSFVSNKRAARQTPQHLQQEYFDWYADNEKQQYTQYAQSPFWQATDTLVFNEWKKAILPGTRLLDVGCAQGRSAFWLADLPITIAAFDISKAMIAQAVGRYHSGKYRASMSFIVSDATHFPFVSRSFDVVLLYGVLHHLAHPAGACQEIVRVLRARGVYFGLENHASPLRLVFDFLQRFIPIWYEKAGTKPIMTYQDFDRWFGPTDMNISLGTRTFLPPHLINTLPLSLARRMIAITDRWASAHPVIAKLGGLLVIEGHRG